MKLKTSTGTKGSPFNSNFGIWLIISRCWLGNMMYFVFLTFSDNLFNSSHFCFSFSSLLITCERDTILSGMFCSSLKRAKRAHQICIICKADWMEMFINFVNVFHINNTQ